MANAKSLICRKARGEKGFSLVEFGLVMIVSGLMIAGSLGVYVNYMKKAKLEASYKRIYAVNATLTDTWRVQNRYLCPASPSLKPGEVITEGGKTYGYGEEIPGCETMASGTCKHGICADAGVKDAGSGQNLVIIGMVPFKSIAENFNKKQTDLASQMAKTKDPAVKEELRLALDRAKKTNILSSKDMAFDGWGRQFTYMVSAAWTKPMSETEEPEADEQKMAIRSSGSIEVVDEAGKALTPKGAHFAVISHGVNGHGSYDSNGMKTGPTCASLTAAEQENCNGDAKIVRAGVQSLVGNVTDDLVAYNVTSSNEMWERVACGDDGDNLCLRNRNVRNVIVGDASAAVEKLTVGGMMRAESMELPAKVIGPTPPPGVKPDIEPVWCDARGKNCFSSDYLGGDKLDACPPGYGSTVLGPAGAPSAQVTSPDVNISKYEMPLYSGGALTYPKKDYYEATTAKLQLKCAAAPIKTFNFNCPADQIVYGLVTDLAAGKVAEPKCYDPCAAKEGTVETVSRSCPAGYSGTMTCQAIYSCSTGTFDNYECNNSSCTPNPVPGACGAAHNVNTMTAPTENLCNTGVASTVSGSGPWAWTCAGQHGGAAANCKADRPISGECGSANDTIFVGPPAPSGSAACSVGSISGMNSSEPYKWQCVGTSGGTTAICESKPRTTVNGQCGSANGSAYTSTPSSDLCGMGSSSGVVDTGTQYTWNCNGGGTPTGSNESCAANKITTVNGACGSANGQTAASTPSSNLCSAGTTSAVTSDANNYYWSCAGGGSPLGGTASCTAPKATTVHGACGASNGGSFSSAPSSGLCAAGSQSGVTTNAGTYTWSCNGTGVPVGNNASCSATRVIVVNGACGGAANSCGSGSASGYNAGSCGGNQTWSCVGSGGGTTASCSIANGACAVAGQCGGSANSCNQGTASGYNAGSCGGSQTWTCLGANGGGNASCSIANAACAVPVHGQCGGSANTCNQGSAVSYNAGSCGGAQTWTCQGSNGGGNASCSVANPGCGPYVFWATNVRVQVDNGAYCSNCGTDYTMGPGFSGDHPYYSSYAWWGGDGSYGGSNNTDSICHAGLIQPGPVVAAGTVNIHGIVSKPYSFTYSPRQVPPYEHNYSNGTGGYGEHYTSTFSVPETNSVCEVKTHVWHYCGRTAGIGTRYDRFPSTDVTCRSADGTAYVARALCQSSGINYSTAPTSANACVRGSSASAANRTGNSTTGSWTWNCTDPMGTVAACSASWEPYTPPPGGGGGCFTGTTEVIMADGSRKAIASLKKGDKVRGHSQTNAVVSNKPFYVRALLYRINDSKDAYVTSNHPFYTKGGGWKAIDVELARKEHPGMQIDKLEIGDILVHADGSEVELKSMESEDHGWLTVYNPSMDGDHTYYANDLLMHNLSEYEVKQ